MGDKKYQEPIKAKPGTMGSETAPTKEEKDDPIHSGPPGKPDPQP